MRRADEQAGRRLRQLEELGRLPERRRHRLLDEHVLARLERGPRERAVLVHARQHEDDVDVGRADHRVGPAQLRVDVVVRGRAAPLRVVDVVDSALTCDAPVGAQPLDHRPVRPGEDAAAADHADTEAHLGSSRDAVVRVGPRGPVDVEAALEADASGQRGGGGERRDRREPAVGRLAAGRAEHRRTLTRTDLLGLREQRIVAGAGGQAQRERSGPERHHRRGRALAGLDALGRDEGDLLQQQRRLQRGRPAGSAAEDDRGLRVDRTDARRPRHGRARSCARARRADDGARRRGRCRR